MLVTEATETASVRRQLSALPSAAEGDAVVAQSQCGLLLLLSVVMEPFEWQSRG